MIRYISQRLLSFVPVILGVTLLVFFMLHLVPGDPAAQMLGEMAVSQEAVDNLREQLGLNKPLYAQYGSFLISALKGELGVSILARRTVGEMVAGVLPSTLILTIAGMGVAIFIGGLFGILAAIFQGSWIDRISMTFAILGVSMPSFWLGLLLIFLFSLRLGWFPATGAGGIERLVLPAITLGVAGSAVISRMTRSSVLEIMRQDYIRTGRAKGLSEAKLVFKHILRNALIPILTIIGLEFGRLLSGTVVLEVVFARPGIGRLLVDAILKKDYQVVQGVVLVSACFYLLVNLLVDLSYSFADPRIRYS